MLSWTIGVDVDAKRSLCWHLQALYHLEYIIHKNKSWAIILLPKRVYKQILFLYLEAPHKRETNKIEWLQHLIFSNITL